MLRPLTAGFHPVSNCWVREVKLIFRECFCILRKVSLFLGNYDPGIHRLPFDSLKNPDQRKRLEMSESGIQFSHTLEKQIGGQLEAGFVLTDLFEDYNGDGKLPE